MSQRLKRPEGVLSSLGLAIGAMNLAKEISAITPAKAAFGAVAILLTMIRDSMINEVDYVELGLSCADVCKALDRGMKGRQLDELNGSVLEAIKHLTKTTAEIQRRIIEQGKRNPVSRLLRAKNDKEMIVSWKVDLNRILHVFNTELAINTHMMVADFHRSVLIAQESFDGRRQAAQASSATMDITGYTASGPPNAPLGESPPSSPRACFGRQNLIEKIVGLAEGLTPTALIGVGGIGKTFIVLSVLHHSRIKERFGENRRFIRCDQFPASRANFLNRLSTVIGAGVENPEDLNPLRPFLSSREILIVIDNAESILDPRGPNGQEIYGVVEELSRINNICLVISSRITIIPPDCETLEIPTLSIESARDAFYSVYKYDGRSDSVDYILKQLDFHPLSVTLLATVAHQNKWDNNRLSLEWQQHRTGVLQTEHKSLASTIEISLTSPMFKELGPHAMAFLEVVAFFPQGINESNLKWLFPSIPNGPAILDKFCALSLTYRSGGFITMLAPLRDSLRPKDPKSSPLLCTTRDRYFNRLSVYLFPDKPAFGKAQWIKTEDMNVEHLLDVFTSVEAYSSAVWNASADFISHLYWHKRRHTLLGPKIEGLPDNLHLKPRCMLELSRLLGSVGNYTERKRLLAYTLTLERGRRNDCQVAESLMHLSDVNRLLALRKEGIRQAMEAWEIYKRLRLPAGEASCLNHLAYLLYEDHQLEAAEVAAHRAIKLLAAGERFLACISYRTLGNIHRSKGEVGLAIIQFNTALKIASPPQWHSELFWIHHSLAELYTLEGKFGCVFYCIEQAKIHALDSAYFQGRAIMLQARAWYLQLKFEEATSEALRALRIMEELGASRGVEVCRSLLQEIERTSDLFRSIGREKGSWFSFSKLLRPSGLLGLGGSLRR